LTGDEWGRDPSVQAFRRIFGRMEEAQFRFLEKLNLSPIDPRLRKWREQARYLFEGACREADRMGIFLDEDRMASLYVRCLQNRLERSGLEVPEECLSPDPDVEKLVRKVAP